MAQDSFHHERLYRGEELMRKFARFKITVCGAGALGANLTENLCRQGFKTLTVIDRDRIELHNINTQPYGAREVGQSKVQVLSASLFRSLKVSIKVHHAELSEKNVNKLLGGAELVVDAFDNSKSRGLVKKWCSDEKAVCLHAGMSDDGYGEAVWNEDYTVPQDVGEDICDYPLARNLAGFITLIASESIINYISGGEKRNYYFTLGDLKISSR